MSCIVLGFVVAVVVKQIANSHSEWKWWRWLHQCCLTQGGLPWVSAPYKTTLVAPLSLSNSASLS
jgi:hypothetical protein